MDFSQDIFKALVGNWFYMPNVSGTPGNLTLPDPGQAMSQFSEVLSTMTDDWYMLILQVCILMIFYHAVGASLKGDPGESIKVIVYLNLVLIIPMFFIQLTVVYQIFAPLGFVFYELTNTRV